MKAVTIMVSSVLATSACSPAPSVAVIDVEEPLTESGAGQAAQFFADGYPAVRTSLNAESFQRLADAAEGATLAIQLVAGTPRRSMLIRKDTQPTGIGDAFVGTVADVPGSSVMLLTSGRSLVGTLQVGDTIVQIGTSADGGLLTSVTRQTDFVAESTPLLPPTPDSGSGPREASCAEEEVDVLIAFTPNAWDRVGGGERAHLFAQFAVQQTNTILMSSDVPHRIRLAHVARIDYDESHNVETDLARVTEDNELRQLRSQHRADIVSVWLASTRLSPDPHTCGLGYVLRSPARQSEWAYNVVRLDCATGFYSFAHEVGHNLGLGHSRAPGEPGGADPWSHGYIDSSRRFRDVMALPCGNTACDPYGRVPYYSTPTKAIENRPLGVPYELDPMQAADNARTARWTICYAAQWR